MKKLKILLLLLALAVLGANVVVYLRQSGLDATPPEIHMDSELVEVSISDEPQAYLAGVTARDNRDGDLTDQVVVEHISQFVGDSTVKVTYAVFDRAGNAATASRDLRFTDYSGPEFRLLKPLRYHVGGTVTLLDRLTAEDPLDGDVTGKIRISSQNLSNDVPGVYYLGVQVTNSLGDTHVCQLPVQILEMKDGAPEIRLTEYMVYVKKDGEFDPRDYLGEVRDRGEYVGTSGVEIFSPVDTAVEGTYEVTYSYEGAAASSQVILTVVVRA